MFIKSKHYDKAIQKVTINLGKELGLENAEDASLTFREPTEAEVLDLRSSSTDKERLDVFKQIFKATLLEHDFWEDETVKMDDGEVIDLLFEKVSTTDKLVQDYTTAVFHFQTSGAEGR